MYVNPKLLERAADPNVLLAFFLAQRGGSSSLAAWLASAVGEANLYHYRYVPKFVHWRQLPPDQLQFYRAYLGFSDFILDRNMKKEFVAFSTVRHPVFRLASLYETSKRDRLLVYHKLALSTDLGGFYRAIAVERPYYVQNLCARRIAGQPNAQAAIETMQKYYGAVLPANHVGLLTQVLVETCGFQCPPLVSNRQDEENYGTYLADPAAKEILEGNSEDVKLYDYVVASAVPSFLKKFTRAARPVAQSPAKPAAEKPAGAKRAPKPRKKPAAKKVAAKPRSSKIAHCPVCDTSLAKVAEGGYCPGCKTPARGRSLAGLLEYTALLNRGPNLEELPLLAFAATKSERQLLTRLFPNIRSVSLYGSYHTDHESGVDVRDLSRFAPDSFAGAFGILLFDYFEEHEKALAELFRVVAPGGSFFTHILTSRIRPDASPPQVTKRIEPRPGYFDYIPPGAVLLNVKVGQDWFLAAMEKAGFIPQQVRLRDEATEEVVEWFVGHKPCYQPPTAKPDKQDAPKAILKPAAKAAPASTFEMRAKVDSAFGFSEVRLVLDIPEMPSEGRRTSFAEHIPGTGQVVAVGKGCVCTTSDLGRNWEFVRLAGMEDADFFNCLTLSNGNRLLQVKASVDATYRTADRQGSLMLYDAQWRLLSETQPARHHWHGPRAAAEAGSTIMFAEYPDNKQKYDMALEHKVVQPGVFRSRDGGLNWEVVFQPPCGEIRHFHLLLPDPCVPRQWWLTSGDRANESRVWLSHDDGDSWREMTDPAPSLPQPKLQGAASQSVHRLTDLWLGPDRLIWGADDWLGGPNGADDLSVPESARVGARLFCSPRTAPLAVESLGWIGNPVRTITDLGEALLVTTEGKKKVLPEPQIYLVSKNDPKLQAEIGTVEVPSDGSGFTYSRASALAVERTMFSFRGRRDLANHPTQVLRWSFDFG
jgi:SAM-dependent methyltransferase